MEPTNERGIAMVVALFMVLITSVIGAALMTVSQTETQSTQNYRMMSQARYAAESGVHHAANYLLNNYPAAGTAGDPIGAYDTTKSPVQWSNQAVVLSSTAHKTASYPIASTKTAFENAVQGVFDTGDARVTYRAHATLRSMRQITDAFTLLPVTLQTWEIIGEGEIPVGARTATVEVTSTMERQTTPLYGYAAFATYNGCGALSFAGGAKTNSYDSAAALGGDGKPVISPNFGNVGTNGNLVSVGNPTVINGSLSTPRQGVGNCSSNNVTAYTGSFDALTGGVNRLSQPITYPTPPAITPAPPTSDYNLNSGCGSILYCSTSGNTMTIAPPTAGTVMQLGNVNTNANMTVHLSAGIYEMNSFTQNGNSRLVVDSGPVIIKVAGAGVTTAIKVNGGGVENTTYIPTNLQFVYGGDKDIILAGGEKTSALFYAPNASASFSGGSDVYGAVVAKYLTESGGAEIHYDRQLQNGGLTAGNPMLSAFSWKTY